MRKAQLASLAVIGVLAGVLATVGGASHDGGGFDTSKPPYLVATAAGVEVDPIISTGDIVGDYQMSGIPTASAATGRPTSKATTTTTTTRTGAECAC